jgi:hypothetical protein
MIDEMLPIEFVSNVNLIQMRLMKVISNLKNMLIHELHRCLESRLIEVMNMTTEGCRKVFASPPALSAEYNLILVT